jgi:hypothetical protein
MLPTARIIAGPCEVSKNERGTSGAEEPSRNVSIAFSEPRNFPYADARD